jgi:hypothetical protein
VARPAAEAPSPFDPDQRGNQNYFSIWKFHRIMVSVGLVLIDLPKLRGPA